MFHISGPILAALDLDERSNESLRQADALARSYKVKLSICHVLPEVFAVRPLYPQLHLEDALMSAGLEAGIHDALLKRVRSITKLEASQIEIVIEQGTVHAGILRAAETIRPGVIVVGGRSDRGWSRMLGGAAEHVVRYAKCPVLVSRPSPAGTVLAATDFSDLALPAVEAGAAEAMNRRADLTIIHAVDLYPVMSPFYGADFSDADPSINLDNQKRIFWRQKLDECVETFKAKGGGLLREGLAEPAILRAASELPAQLIVMGTHGRTGLSRIVSLGSVAEAVVRDAPCSVLVVRLG